MAPHVEHVALADAPKDPHLGYCHEIVGGQRFVTALPRGTYMYIIVPGGNPSVVPLVLLEVRPKHLTFKCGCGKKDCTRRLIFKGRWEGWHEQSGPIREDPALQTPPEGE